MSDELSLVFDAVCRRADQAARAQRRLAQANTEAKNELLPAIADALDRHAADIEAANALDILESGKRHGCGQARPPAVRRAARSRRRPKACAMWPPCPIRSARSCADTQPAQRSAPYPDARADGRHQHDLRGPAERHCGRGQPASSPAMPALLQAATPPDALTRRHVGVVIAPVAKPTVSESALVQSVDQYGRAGATAMMEARGHIDVLVPRGEAGLIQAVVRNSKCRSSKPVPATCISISTSR